MYHKSNDSYRNTRSAETFHGHINSPKSRAYFAWEEGKLNLGQLNQCESGKFFPELKGGIQDSFAPTDSANNTPPPDGRIASGNQPGMEFLDEPGTHWQTTDVRSGGKLDISWYFTAIHVTRRWNYFITKADWNPNKVLSRSQFESVPIATDQIGYQPFWEHSDKMKPSNPYNYSLTLPNRKGYHVLLAVWEVADTGNAFHQVIDLNFISEGGGDEKPSTPTGLKATEVTERSISLSWNANPSTDPYPITAYRIVRDGTTTVDVAAPALTWTDSGVTPGTTYSYFINAIDTMGNISLPGRELLVTTPQEGGDENPPGAPRNLHTMAITDNSIDLMWAASISNNPVKLYHIYQDGLEISSTSSLTWTATNLQAETKYQYFVVAEDDQGLFSVPGNVLFVTTKKKEGGSDIPEWESDTPYKVGDLVNYHGNTYRCLQAHTSNPAWDPVSTNHVLWALKR
ncbi:lytic polysaccharide monooxygenase [Enterobacteriaceae bacterium LUAb1]